MQVFKILTNAQWERLRDDGAIAGAPVDIADGYVHLSGADTVTGTLEKHFAGQRGLVLAAVETDGLGDDLRWELAPKRGADFPHLYRELRLTDVVWAGAITNASDGSHGLPPLDGSRATLHRA